MVLQTTLALDEPTATVARFANNQVLPAPAFRDSAFEQNKSTSIHRWVPWIAGFSADFVKDAFRHYLPNPESRNVTVFEPFAGVGTTMVESLLHGYDTVGFEINPFAALASRVKCNAFLLESHDVLCNIHVFEHKACQRIGPLDEAYLAGDDISQCRPDPKASTPKGFRSRVPFFSPIIGRKVLHCLDVIHELPNPQVRDLFLLAFGAVLVRFSNYSYEPSLGSRAAAGKPEIPNADVVAVITAKLRAIHEDLICYRSAMARFEPAPRAEVYNQNALRASDYIQPGVADLVVTSPPYLNNYHYVRNTRPHLFWLNFVAAPTELKKLEEANFGKFWQTVRDAPPKLLSFHMPALEECITEVAAMHPEKGVYGGQGWANYAVEYFNDCFTMCQVLRYALKPGGVAVFVLGNSIMQGVEIPTDRIFGQIGELCGLELEDIHLLRTKRIGNSVVNSSIRNGRPTKATLYETAVVLRNPDHREYFTCTVSASAGIREAQTTIMTRGAYANRN